MYQSLVKRVRGDDANENIVPLSLIKNHVIVQHDYDDDVLVAYRDAAIQHVEDATRRTLPLSEYRVGMDHFESPASFMLPPIRAVSDITYKNSSGDVVTIDPSTYDVDLGYEHGRITTKSGWPAQACNVAFKVIAGYGLHDKDAGYPYQFPMPYGVKSDAKLDLPRPLHQAILLLIGHWYANREAVVVGTIAAETPLAVDSLLFPYKNYLV